MLEAGATLRYDRLLIATGSHPRRLELLDGADNVHVLRTCDDALALRNALRPGARLAVVGAGFVGQEVAATARRLGRRGDARRPGAGAAAPACSALRSGSGSRGCTLRRASTFVCRDRCTRPRQRPRRGARARGRHGSSRRTRCSSASASSRDRLARGSGLGTGPVRVDAASATAVPDVFAAGDAAGGHHWDAAARQGVAAAHGMLGLAPPAPVPPTFWSDQYGVRLQLVGAPSGHDRVDLDGDPASRDFHAVFRRDGRPVAGLAVGRPHELPRLRRLITQPEAEVIP